MDSQTIITFPDWVVRSSIALRPILRLIVIIPRRSFQTVAWSTWKAQSELWNQVVNVLSPRDSSPKDRRRIDYMLTRQAHRSTVEYNVMMFKSFHSPRHQVRLTQTASLLTGSCFVSDGKCRQRVVARIFPRSTILSCPVTRQGIDKLWLIYSQRRSLKP